MLEIYNIYSTVIINTVTLIGFIYAIYKYFSNKYYKKKKKLYTDMFIDRICKIHKSVSKRALFNIKLD